MSRLIAHAYETSLWQGAKNLLCGFSQALTNEAGSEVLSQLDREHARIRLQSRHWLA